ncbi:DNA-binding response regulator [Paenibacillus sp. FSL H8-0548]|uniref:response regulator transcription factor n=1 Tax=Paenibacillus sp. FSL H8-0548 TaxID=1920422 RepID=UPI00096DEFE2|nr:response regulator [Paenibacillus sp. FSL H8-0548]OMF18868.1 DNA-binding response regulator [Paenibacillus sp. FSL H8-0548]
MHSLLIVEDEVYIANKLKSSLDWKELGISDIFVVHNIRQAKELFEKYLIDIMICDIEMPQGNGIELLEWIREHNLKTESMFLTCHADFEYTKKAIQLGSLDYLLKPVQQEELRAVILKALKKINKERPRIIEHFWLDLIHQSIPSNPEKIRENIAIQNIPYSETTSFLPILIGVQHWEKKLSIREENIMEYALRKTAEELLLQKGMNGQIIQVKRGYILVVIPFVETYSFAEREKVKESCQSFIQACNQYLYCQLSCYIGETVIIQDMLGIYERLVDFHHDNVSLNNQVFFYQEKTIADETIPLPQMNVWSEMLKFGNKHKLLMETMEFLESWKQLKGIDAKKLQQFYQSFLQMLLYALQQKGLMADRVFSNHLSPDRALIATRSVKDLQIWIKELLEIAFLHMFDNESSLSVVDKIKIYITSQLDQALSRQYIADHIGLSPDYIVKIFKKETGLSISDYIVQERIRISKDLLTKSDLPISSIALAVGFSNFAYFSTIFKKEVCMTPQDYRKKCQ